MGEIRPKRCEGVGITWLPPPHSCPGLCLLTRVCCRRQGNKDPPAASLALDHVSEAVAQLAKLPESFRSFYVSAARYVLCVRVAYADAARAVVGGRHDAQLGS